MPQPTQAPAGSPEKVAVLRRRWECGECLFHPQDPWWESESVTMICESLSLSVLLEGLADYQHRYADE